MPRDRACTLRQTMLTVWPLLATVLCLLALSWWALGTLSAARGYVAGNSIWSRAQKEAVIHILRYAHEGRESDYVAFTRAIAPITGDRKARLALQSAPPDLAVAREGFLEGENAAEDVAGMITLFSHHQHTALMAPAVEVWETADDRMLELEATAAAIRRVRLSDQPSAAELERLEKKISSLDEELTSLEQSFSDRIGEAFRDLTTLLQTAMLAATVLLGSLGMVVIHRVLAAAERTRAERDALQADVQITFRLTQALNRSSLEEEIYSPALDAVLEALAIERREDLPERATMSLPGSDGVMRIKAWRSVSEGYRRAFEGSAPWQRYEPPLSVRVEDTDKCPDAALRDLLHQERVGASIYIPLMQHAQLLGMITVLLDRPRPLSRRDVRTLQTIAAQVAEAISRAHLFESEHVLARDYAQLYERERQAVGARDQFIAMAGHELRTPLTALKLNAQLIERSDVSAQAQLRDPNFVKKTLDRLTGNIDRLERLVVQLLDVSRINAGRLPLVRQPTELGALVRAVVEGAQPEIQGSGSSVTLSIDEPLTGSWDPDRVEQVATNLLHNAIKYGCGKPIDVRIERHDDAAVLTVRDRGMGIAPEDQKRIFERFERASSVQHFGGFGLGLWIVRALVEAHGGTVSVSSIPGAGATFRVALPLYERLVESEAAHTLEPRTPAERTVM